MNWKMQGFHGMSQLHVLRIGIIKMKQFYSCYKLEVNSSGILDSLTLNRVCYWGNMCGDRPCGIFRRGEKQLLVFIFVTPGRAS